MLVREQRLNEVVLFIHRLFSIMPCFDPLILLSFTQFYSSLFLCLHWKERYVIADLQMECWFCYSSKFTYESDQQDCNKLVMKRENRG